MQQNLELFDMRQVQLEARDRAITAHVESLTAQLTPPSAPLPKPRSTWTPRSTVPAFEIRTQLHHLTGGVDLIQIDGIAPDTALKLLAEIGTDMRRWPTAQHFTSWLTLAPKNKVSGGRLLSSRTQPSANRAAVIFRLAAMSLGRTQTALGAFYRRLAARIGKPKRSPPRHVSSPCLSTTSSRAISCMSTPAPTRTTPSSAPAFSVGYVNAPSDSGLRSSAAKPGRWSESSFLGVAKALPTAERLSMCPGDGRTSGSPA